MRRSSIVGFTYGRLALNVITMTWLVSNANAKRSGMLMSWVLFGEAFWRRAGEYHQLSHAVHFFLIKIFFFFSSRLTECSASLSMISNSKIARERTLRIPSIPNIATY